MDNPTNTNPTQPSRLDSLLAQRALLERRIKALAAKQTSAKRKAAQRAKFLLGEAVLAQHAQDPALLDRLCVQLRPKDQALVRSVATGSN